MFSVTAHWYGVATLEVEVPSEAELETFLRRLLFAKSSLIRIARPEGSVDANRGPGLAQSVPPRCGRFPVLQGAVETVPSGLDLAPSPDKTANPNPIERES